MIIEDPEKWKVGGCISVPSETNRKLSIGVLLLTIYVSFIQFDLTFKLFK